MVTSFKETRSFYSVNLKSEEADLYRDFLRDNQFYFETSFYVEDIIHFEIYLNSEELRQADAFLATI